MYNISMNGRSIGYLTHLVNFIKMQNISTERNHMTSANDNIFGLSLTKEELIQLANISFEKILNTDLSLPMELEEV